MARPLLGLEEERLLLVPEELRPLLAPEELRPLLVEELHMLLAPAVPYSGDDIGEVAECPRHQAQAVPCQTMCTGLHAR